MPASENQVAHLLLWGRVFTFQNFKIGPVWDEITDHRMTVNFEIWALRHLCWMSIISRRALAPVAANFNLARIAHRVVAEFARTQSVVWGCD